MSETTLEMFANKHHRMAVKYIKLDITPLIVELVQWHTSLHKLGDAHNPPLPSNAIVWCLHATTIHSTQNLILLC